MMRPFIRLRWLLAFAISWLSLGLAQAEPQNGWWWNPAESGRGFFIEMQDDVLFLAGYFYEADGRSTWLISAGGFDTPYSYSGRLLKVTGGQTLFGEYQAPTETDVGAISLEFADDTHGALVWPGGTISIERQVFSNDSASFQPTGWWWNPDESGRGYSIEVQGQFLFIAAFMYDDAGNPIWFISAGKMTSDTHYEGDLLQVTGGQTIDGPYHPPIAETPVGRVIIDFASLEEATITFSDEAPANVLAAHARSKASRSKTIYIKKQLRASRPAAPANWNGFYRKVEKRQIGKREITLTWRGPATFGNPSSTAGNASVTTVYSVIAGVLNVTYESTDTDDEGTCEGKGEASHPLTEGSLILAPNGYYLGQLKYPNVIIDASLTCTSGGGSATVPIEVTPDFVLDFGGHVTIRLSTLGSQLGRFRHLESKGGNPTWDFTEVTPLPP